MSNSHKPPATTGQNVAAFLEQVARTPVKSGHKGKGKLMFAIDATASREPTWDTACQLQAQMFSETAVLGGLSVQLCYYRGFNDFYAGPWCDDSATLLKLMTGVRCQGGHTQISRIFSHARDEARAQPIHALVFVGDAMEENPDTLCNLAGELGLLNLPIFVFQEGNDPAVRSLFQQIARLSGGAYARFDASSASQLRQLLAAVAVFAAGGRKALADFSKKAGADVLLLTRQLK